VKLTWICIGGWDPPLILQGKRLHVSLEIGGEKGWWQARVCLALCLAQLCDKGDADLLPVKGPALEEDRLLALSIDEWHGSMNPRLVLLGLVLGKYAIHLGLKHVAIN
jgi:hypothetical protein